MQNEKRNTTEITRRLEILLKDEKKKNKTYFTDWTMLAVGIIISYVVLWKLYSCDCDNTQNSLFLIMTLLSLIISYLAFTRIFDRG